MSASAEVRYNFTFQFLHGAAIFARQARAIEDSSEPVSEEDRATHRACVVSAVMQAVAALEAEASSIVLHGPGNHLGSNGLDKEGWELLVPLSGDIDRFGVLGRYEVVLYVLRRKRLRRGADPYQNTALLVRLRNELVHYRSRTGSEMDSRNLFTGLRGLRLAKPPFAHANSNFFPGHLLSSSCASWSILTATSFLNHFYELLSIPSPLGGREEKLAVPEVRINGS